MMNTTYQIPSWKIPKWALKKQKRLHPSKFQIGDIVYVDTTRSNNRGFRAFKWTNGIAVVMEVDDDLCSYAVDFGPYRINGGWIAWYDEEDLTLLKSKE